MRAGRVTALTAGSTTISASAGAQRSSASVRVHASAAATSGALIAAALASGSLSAEQALTFASGKYEIDARSLLYEHLKFGDATVHSVMLVNPNAILPQHGHMKLQAVKQIGGQWQAVEDWTEDLDAQLLPRPEGSACGRVAAHRQQQPRRTRRRRGLPHPGAVSDAAEHVRRRLLALGRHGQHHQHLRRRLPQRREHGSGVVRWDVAAALPGSVQFSNRGPVSSTASPAAGWGSAASPRRPSARCWTPPAAVSADGRTLEGQYVASFPLTRSSITTRFKFTAQRE